MTSFLHIDRCSLKFGGLAALVDFSLTMEPGELVGVIGPNGAGKTTLFNVLTGVYAPSAGTLDFCGVDLAPLAPHAINRLGIARTFQNIRLFAGLTVLDNVRLALHGSLSQSMWQACWRSRSFCEEEERVHDEARSLLAEFGLDEKRDLRAGALPYGHQRRLEIIRALATKPKLLLLDEPAAGMHPKEKQTLIEFIRAVNVQRGIAIVLIEHDMKVVMHVCPRLMVLDYGVTIAEGTPEEIRRDPKVIEAYLGTAMDH